MSGSYVTLPDRLILVASEEREDPIGEVRFGNEVILIPFEDLTFDLVEIDLQAHAERFNEEYRLDSDSYLRTVLYIDRIEDHDDLPTYVMARLMERTATRCVWSVTPEGKPIPLTIAFTHDRQGYYYRDSYTRNDALYKNLLRP